jgi:hypothetical protein
MNQLSEELNSIWNVEETRARQRARDVNIKEEDRNTKYFRTVANHRRRKSTIHNIEGPAGTISNTEEIIKVATQYYKDMFKFEPRPNMNINENFFSKEEKITQEENRILEERFTEEEVKKVVFESYSDRTPGPDGLSFIFCQQFWDVIKGDLMDMFEDFYTGKLDIYSLNYALITIIPKEKNDRTMNKFRPISFLNCSYNFFTRVLTI